MGKLDELIGRLGSMAKPRTLYVSHESSNLDSIASGFASRPSGLSFARLPHERMSSPAASEPLGRRGIVYATVSGDGVDYDASAVSGLIDEALAASVDEFGSADAVIPALRNSGVQWVNNWNSIGRADELHVLDPRAVQVRRIFELSPDKSYRFPTPMAVQPSARAYGLDDYSQPIIGVRR